MRATRVTAALVGLGCLWAVLGARPVVAEAQYIQPNMPPQFGRLSYRTDPTTATGVAGGPVRLGDVDGSCRGTAGMAPSHVFQVDRPMPFLRVVVHGDIDTTLFIQTADGRIICDDDGGEGLDPQIDLSVGPGPLRVWVGSYGGGTGGYTIGFTTSPGFTSTMLTGGYMPPPPPPPPVAGIQPNMPPAFGQVQVSRGFVPDVVQRGSYGGAIQASSVDGSCRGWVSPQPSHVVVAQTSFANLRFVVSASSDTTLMVMYPDGRIVCNDDGGGSLNPLIEGPTMPGQIRIWVGSYSSGGSGAYMIGFTENPGVNYGNLGMAPPQVLPPPPPPPPVMPRIDVTVVDMAPRIPVTLFGPGLTTATVAAWAPRGGPRVQVGINQVGSGLEVTASVDGSPVTIFTVPAEVANGAVVTVTQLANTQLLVRAESVDTDRQMLLLVRWDGSQPQVAQQWVGSIAARAPRWSR